MARPPAEPGAEETDVCELIRVRVKPDAWDRFRALDERWQREQAPIAPDFKGSYILRELDSPNGCVMIVLFESRELCPAELGSAGDRISGTSGSWS